MIKKLIPLSVAATAILTGAVYAQDTTTTAGESQAETSQATGTGLDLGESGPRIGEQYVKEEFGDWDLACVKTETEADPCALVQLLTGQDGNPMAEVTVSRLQDGGVAVAGATVIVPLETFLPAQLELSIDGAPSKRYNYRFCNTVGCFSQLGLTQSDVDAMKGGSEAIVSVVPAQAPNQVLQMKMSLKGFTSGFETLIPRSN